jgi:transposase-like protein
MTEFIITEDFPKNEAEFDKRFSSEQACFEYLFKLRWPEGFICKTCGHEQYWHSRRGLYICKKCEHQHSLIAGTILQNSKKPVTSWFKAMWWFTTRKSGVNAINLQDLLGLGSYETAWSWLQKLRSCTIRQDREKLAGKVEADEFYIGGQESGGKRGRAAEHKCAVAIAVEKKGKKLGRIRLQVVDDCSRASLHAFINEHVQEQSNVITDGWSGYTGLDTQGYRHDLELQNEATDKASVLPGAHLVISLVKRLILGTFQGRFHKKHLQKYLDEFVFRFNRRSVTFVGKKFMRIAEQAVLSKPLPFRLIVNGALVAS